MRPLRRSTLVAIGFVLAFASAGCVKKPTMHLERADVTGVQLMTFPPQLGVVMTVVVDVYNPNGYDVAVRAVRGQVVLADRFPVAVDFHAPGDGVWLPADTTTRMSVPIQIPVQVAVAILQMSWTTAATIPYRMTGRADVTGTRTFKIESDDYSVNEQGVIDRQQIDASIRGVFVPH